MLGKIIFSRKVKVEPFFIYNQNNKKVILGNKNIFLGITFFYCCIENNITNF